MERKQASSLKVSSLGFQQDTYYYPHLRMKKLRVRGTKQLAPDYSKQKSQDLNQVPPTPEPHSVTSLTTSREVRGLKSWSPGHLTTHQKCRPTESEYAFSHDIRPLNYQATFFPLRVICIITGKIIQLAANPISSHKELSKERGLQDFVLTGQYNLCYLCIWTNTYHICNFFLSVSFLFIPSTPFIYCFLSLKLIDHSNLYSLSILISKTTE